MKRMAASDVIILGMRGLGVEIGSSSSHPLPSPCSSVLLAAKNICLAGVKSVTIYDPEPVQMADLGTQVRQRPLQL